MNKEKLTTIVVAGVLIGGIIPIGILLINNQSDVIDGYIFYDSVGRSVIVPYEPESIVSLSPSITEIIYEIEVDDKLIGITTLCDYPDNITGKTLAGGYNTANLEVILSLNADLIISAFSGWSQEDILNIEKLGIAFIIITASTLDEIIDQITIIAEIAHAGTKGEEVVNKLKSDMAEITTKTSTIDEGDKLNCSFEIWSSPMVVGGNSYISDIIQKAGGINIYQSIDLEYPVVTHESIIASNPEVIFIAAHGAYTPDDVAERVGYSSISAVINNRIYSCGDYFLRSGPRAFLALENMTRYLYPPLF